MTLDLDVDLDVGVAVADNVSEGWETVPGVSSERSERVTLMRTLPLPLLALLLVGCEPLAEDFDFDRQEVPVFRRHRLA